MICVTYAGRDVTSTCKVSHMHALMQPGVITTPAWRVRSLGVGVDVYLPCVNRILQGGVVTSLAWLCPVTGW
jgi:hypothetical protein